MSELIAPAAVRAQQQTGGGPTIVDVRSQDEYTAGRIAGARHIPLDQLAARSGELPAGRPVVTYCMMRHRGDSRGERAAALLRARGGERTQDGAGERGDRA